MNLITQSRRSPRVETVDGPGVGLSWRGAFVLRGDLTVAAVALHRKFALQRKMTAGTVRTSKHADTIENIYYPFA
jgi:hypothetical protein